MKRKKSSMHTIKTKQKPIVDFSEANVIIKNADAAIRSICLVGLIASLLYFFYGMILNTRTKYDALLGIPIFGSRIILYFLNKEKHLKPFFFYSVLLLFTFYSVRTRHAGIEYTIIAMACSAGFLFKNTRQIIVGMICSALCYMYSYFYDKQVEFVPDPALNYTIQPLITMAFSGGVVCAIILMFRRTNDAYAAKLYASLAEHTLINEQLKINEQVIKIEKEKAEAASIAKSEFLANMSHEIRTPLNGVIGFSELLMSTKLSEVQKQYMSTVSQSASSLLDIINDILDFSKIESGKLDLLIEKADLVQISEQVADITKYQAHKKGLEILLNVPANIPRYIWADEIRLRQVLINLMSNAVKFTEVGEIEFKVEELGKNLNGKSTFRFSVRDTGIGVAKENQQKIFEAFSQEDGSTTKRFGGTGLGLTISNRLLQLMNSKLQLESELNKGSVFYFDIEFAAINGQEFHWENLHNINEVLVVDDNDNNRLILKEMLALKNINCDEASNGYEALQMLEAEKKYDVIIMDYHMPYQDGIDTIRQIRNGISASQHQPIILLYSSSDDSIISVACEELKINKRMVKPIKINQLYNTLSNLYIKNNSGTGLNNIEINKTEKTAKFDNKLKILIAEDNPFNTKLCKIMVSQIAPNAIILEAKNGIEAVDAFNAEQPDIIFMDLQMPQMGGYEASQIIREKQTDKKPQIIALTAGVAKGEKEKCIEAGMDDYITKPFVKKTMEQVIETCIVNLN